MGRLGGGRGWDWHWDEVVADEDEDEKLSAVCPLSWKVSLWIEVWMLVGMDCRY